MTFDAHQLDSFLLVGSAVTILAILAVRVSSRAGLPSLMIYLLMGVALGESGPGQIKFDNAELTHALGFAALVVILAEGGLTTSWREIRPAMRHGSVPGDRRRGRLGRGDDAGGALPARPAVGARDPPWRGDLTHRRRGGVLRAARRPSSQTADGCPRSRVWSQRRPDRGAGDPGVDRSGPGARDRLPGRHHRVRARRRCADRPRGGIRRRLGHAAGSVAVLGSLPVGRPRAHVPCVRRRSSRPCLRIRRRVRRRARARQLRAATPDGHPVVLGGHGLAGPDRPVRDARTAPYAQPDHGSRSWVPPSWPGSC